MNERDRELLLDMREAALRIQEYLAGRMRSDLDTCPMLFDAVVRQFEILGEAARTISTSGRQCLLSVPWRAIIGMRNQLIHAYKGVDADAVWRTALEDLPPLLEAIAPWTAE